LVASRICAQCGAVFTPHREHARFCAARCRVAWHRERTGDPVIGASALQWSVPAMSEMTRRLAASQRADRFAVFAAISDAVWMVTIVDAGLVRYHPNVYDQMLAGEDATRRRLLEEGLAGLRFIRNQIPDEAAVAQFVEPKTSESAADGSAAEGWTWRSVTEAHASPRRPRGQVWEVARFRAYQASLAGRPVCEVFDRAEPFLNRAAARAATVLIS